MELMFAGLVTLVSVKFTVLFLGFGKTRGSLSHIILSIENDEKYSFKFTLNTFITCIYRCIN